MFLLMPLCMFFRPNFVFRSIRSCLFVYLSIFPCTFHWVGHQRVSLQLWLCCLFTAPGTPPVGVYLGTYSDPKLLTPCLQAVYDEVWLFNSFWYSFYSTPRPYVIFFRPGRFTLSYIHIYIYTYTYTHIYLWVWSLNKVWLLFNSI